jgi:hypothetical protein
VKLGAETIRYSASVNPTTARRSASPCCGLKNPTDVRAFSAVDEKTAQETLTWLNVSDDLSIDGKTVLFAALSGSLENHPDAFNFQQ